MPENKKMSGNFTTARHFLLRELKMQNKGIIWLVFYTFQKFICQKFAICFVKGA